MKQSRKDRPPPLYRMVKEHIVRQIEDGSLTPGALVPSEYALVGELGYSRMTINRAIRELTAEGWLRRVQGVGTFVAEPKPQSTLIEIKPIAEEIMERGGTHGARVVSLAAVAADPDTAQQMGIGVHDRVFHVVIVHAENGVPIQIENRYVNPSLAPKFLDQDFTRVTPSRYLLSTVPYTDIEHVIEARMPSAGECDLLSIDDVQPCLILSRRTWVNKEVVTQVRLIHPGAKFKLGSRFKPIRSPFSLVA